MEYPRACEAKITYVEDGSIEVIKADQTADALKYELDDMEEAVNGERRHTYLDYTMDVIDTMTEFRRQWGLCYPEEE